MKLFSFNVLTISRTLLNLARNNELLQPGWAVPGSDRDTDKNMSQLKQNESQSGVYTIQRNANGFRIIHTETGVGIATEATFNNALMAIQDCNFMNALVKMHGKERAAEMLLMGEIVLPSIVRKTA